MRFGQSLAFFDTAAIGTSVCYEDLGTTVHRDGLNGVAEQIGRVVRERRPGLIVIDSFKALQAFAAGPSDFRKFLHELAGRLGAFPAASLWVGEYEDAEIASVAEFAVADAIVNLTTERVGHWSLHEPNVEIMYRSPVVIYIDEWVYELLDTVERTGAQRVLIDSLADLRMAAADEIRFQEFIYSIVQRFSRQSVSVLMTMEIPYLFGADRISESGVSPLADNVVMLSYQRERDTMSRTMAIIKTRASHNDPAVRKFVIGPQGIVLDRLHQAAGNSDRDMAGLSST